MAYENILVERRDKAGLITLNRPQALNALSKALVADLNTALAEFEADDAIGAVVITGSEKAFAAGADIREIAGTDFVGLYRDDFVREWDRVAECRKPPARRTTWSIKRSWSNAGTRPA